MDYLQKWSRRATVVWKASCTFWTLRCIQCMIFFEEDTSLHVRCTKVEKRIQGWKTTLRKKRLHQEENMQEFSSKPMSLNKVTAVVESKAMWEHYAMSPRE